MVRFWCRYCISDFDSGLVADVTAIQSGRKSATSHLWDPDHDVARRILLPFWSEVFGTNNPNIRDQELVPTKKQIPPPQDAHHRWFDYRMARLWQYHLLLSEERLRQKREDSIP